MWSYNSEAEALQDVLRLSRGMSYKAAIAGLNLGGGKAVIIGDSKKNKNEILFRSFGSWSRFRMHVRLGRRPRSLWRPSHQNLQGKSSRATASEMATRKGKERELSTRKRTCEQGFLCKVLGRKGLAKWVLENDF